MRIDAHLMRIGIWIRMPIPKRDMFWKNMIIVILTITSVRWSRCCSPFWQRGETLALSALCSPTAVKKYEYWNHPHRDKDGMEREAWWICGNLYQKMEVLKKMRQGDKIASKKILSWTGEVSAIIAHWLRLEVSFRNGLGGRVMWSFVGFV